MIGLYNRLEFLAEDGAVELDVRVHGLEVILDLRGMDELALLFESGPNKTMSFVPGGQHNPHSIPSGPSSRCGC